MNDEQVSKKEAVNEQVDPEAARITQAIEKIKQPPSINETLMDLPPEELLTNPAVAPEMIQERSDLRHDLTRD